MGRRWAKDVVVYPEVPDELVQAVEICVCVRHIVIWTVMWYRLTGGEWYLAYVKHNRKTE